MAASKEWPQKIPNFENPTDLRIKELVTMIIGVVPALRSGWHLKAPANRAKYPMNLFKKKSANQVMIKSVLFSLG
jgi:hypothetical protein